MNSANDAGLWIKEIYQGNVGLSFKVEATLFAGQSAYQKIDIVKTRSHGIMLLNNGAIMLSERDEFIYHEMITHVPLFSHPDPRKVLIIGGGDGGAVREALKHKNIERIVLVEIDEMVINASREFIPSVSCALDNPRLEIVIRDGIDYVNAINETFDIVLIDSTDPIGPARPLFDKAFYQSVQGILTKQGIMVSQAESPFYDIAIQTAMLANQRPFFKQLHLYLFPTLTYPGGLWSLGFASQGVHPVLDFDFQRVDKAKLATQYYNPLIHTGAFRLPNFCKHKLLDPVDLRKSQKYTEKP